MKAEDIIFYLRKSGMTDMQYKGGKLKYVRIACPFAEIKHSNKRDRHDSFGVQVDADGTSFYHCFSCKSHGSFWQLFGTVGIHRPLDRDSLVEIGNEVYKEDVMEMATGRLSRAVQRYSYDVEDYEDTETLPDLDHMEYHFKTFSTDHEYLKHYLTDRGINHSLIKDFDIRYDDIKERIVVPIYSATGEFVGMVGRSIDPNEQVQKVYNYPGTRTDFGFGRLKGDDLSSYNRIILVEGQFDLKKTYQNLSELGLKKDYGVVSLFKSVLSEYQAEWLEELNKSVYSFLDHGQAGDTGRKQIERLLKGRIPRLTHIMTRDSSEDAGDIASEELGSLLRINAGSKPEHKKEK